jgi:hypothetical protein
MASVFRTTSAPRGFGRLPGEFLERCWKSLTIRPMIARAHISGLSFNESTTATGRQKRVEPLPHCKRGLFVSAHSSVDDSPANKRKAACAAAEVKLRNREDAKNAKV